MSGVEIMAATERLLRNAKAFADAYAPGDDDHVDLESRVVMYRRAVESGSKRAVAVHARTLMRFVGHLGLDVPGSAADGPSKAELQEQAEALGLSKRGTKAELAERIAEAEAAAGS